MEKEVVSNEVSCLLLIQLEDGEEGFLRYLYVAYLLHAFLASFLLFEQLALAAHITTIALGGHVFAYLLDGFTGDDLGSDGGLHGDVELLSGYQLFELLTHAASQVVGIALVGEGGEGINWLAVEEDVELDELGRTEAVGMVVERGIALRDALQLVVEVDDNFS